MVQFLRALLTCGVGAVFSRELPAGARLRAFKRRSGPPHS